MYMEIESKQHKQQMQVEDQRDLTDEINNLYQKTDHNKSEALRLKGQIDLYQRQKKLTWKEDYIRELKSKINSKQSFSPKRYSPSPPPHAQKKLRNKPSLNASNEKSYDGPLQSEDHGKLLEKHMKKNLCQVPIVKIKYDHFLFGTRNIWTKVDKG